MKRYVPLFCKSHYSFLEGASSPSELVDAARSMGMEALAITDRDGLYGVVRAHLRAMEVGVKLIIGSEVTLDDQSTILLIVRSLEGYQNLSQLISRGRLRCSKGESRVTWQEVCEHAGGLFAMLGGRRSLLATDELDVGLTSSLRDAFGESLFARVERLSRVEDVRTERLTRNNADTLSIPIVAANEVLFHTPPRRELQDVLTAIRTGYSLQTIGDRTAPNAQHCLQSCHAFERLFRDDMYAVQRTNEIAAACRFSMGELDYRYPQERTPEGESQQSWLHELTAKGAELRYPEGIPADVQRQLSRELELIEELGYGGYFLTMKEIVEFCRSQNILCQGRGSAANSAVCFCLGITAVDPVRMDMLFERFLSRERAEPPDIDLDIEHNRREEVIQFVYRRYGRDRAAMVANVIRYRAKSAFRDVGRALGVSETTLNRVSKLLPGYGGRIREELLEEAGMDADARITGHVIRLANELMDTPRHLSIHPGGFILGNVPIANLVPVENATMPGRTVIQWDKYDVEALGLFKIDLLGLGALTQIHHAFDLIREHRGERWSMATVPAADPATFEMLTEADTVGVFQIESRAQMSMLPRLRPREFYDLVIEVSIVRPGPITGGMVHPYLRRRNGEEPIVYPHPSLKPVLERTLGVPLFQEQVMKLAMVAADYTPGEADQLRRDMAAWKQCGRIELHRDRMIERMTSRGIAREFAERVFEQIRGFGEYGFPESHAASFALIAWVTSWLKCNYHPEFTCALLNAQPMGFYSPATIVEDARRKGVVFHRVCVAQSMWDCTLEPAGAKEPPARPGGTNPNQTALNTKTVPHHPISVRMGMRCIRGLSREHAERIVACRQQGEYASIEDLVRRTGLKPGVLTKLAEAGAFDSLGLTRRDALWEIHRVLRQPDLPLSLPTSDEPVVLPDLTTFESITWDYRRVSHSTDGHPLEALRPQLRTQRLPDSSELRQMPNGRKTRYAGLIICRQRPGTASGVVFLTLEDECGFVNLVVWPDIFEKHSTRIRTTTLLGVKGRVQKQNGICHLIAESFFVPNVDVRQVEVKQRNFH